MTTEEKEKAILEAVESKRISGNKLDVSGRGKAVTRIKQGKASIETIDKVYITLVEILGISKSQITQATETIKEEIKGIEQKPETQPEKEAVKMDANMLNKIAERFEGIERENKTLRETIAGLQGEIERLKQAGITRDNQASITNNIPGITEYNQASITKDNQSSGLLRDYERIAVGGLDFIIRLEKQVSSIRLASGEAKQVSYNRYYAKKKIAGKLHRIYIGEIAERSQAEAKIKAYIQKHSLVMAEFLKKF